MYNYYKPLRNFVRKLNRSAALIEIGRLMQHINYATPLPAQFFCFPNASIREIIHPWELVILAREVILHGGDSDQKSLFSVKDLLQAINYIRGLVDQQSKVHINSENVLHEVHRISQQQFPWHAANQTKLARYLKIYRKELINSVLVENTGLSIDQIYLMGFTLGGHFIKNSAYDMRRNPFKEFGISDKQKDQFFSLVSMGIEELKDRTVRVQEYNENWSYTINPLLSTPLVILDKANPSHVICPVPNFLQARISEGLFFDVFKVKNFANAYGFAYESYVVDITNILISATSLRMERGSEYYVNKSRKNGVDLYVYDSQAAILVECKAKRFSLGSKYQGNVRALSEDLTHVAESVVQNYKNLLDVAGNITPWSSNGRSLHPIIVTLMECFIWTPPMQSYLDSVVEAKMNEAKLDLSIRSSFPYTIMSIDEYELSIQIINQVGIQQFFTDRQIKKYEGWSTESFVQAHYASLLPNCRMDHLKHEIETVIQRSSH